MDATFRSLVIGDFDFLVDDYGFRYEDHHANLSVEKPEYIPSYRKHPIEIYFFWGNGEVDINIVVNLDFTVNHPVFRPFLTRTFGVGEITRHQDRNAFANLNLPQWTTSTDQLKAHLAAYAKLMKQYCDPILKGDLSILETIHKDRHASSG